MRCVLTAYLPWTKKFIKSMFFNDCNDPLTPLLPSPLNSQAPHFHFDRAEFIDRFLSLCTDLSRGASMPIRT